jgi:alkanesulfonate monooxygenase SsuD/methylene tetrahydromethanopterin reductase-like flavin-dependent oxidoreductase (luciferase family)
MTPDEHDDRYARGEEWWRIVKTMWSGGAAVDFDGRFYQLHALEGSPSPFGGRRPLMMNAGASPAGRMFAAQLGPALRLLPHTAGQRFPRAGDQAARKDFGTQD